MTRKAEKENPRIRLDTGKGQGSGRKDRREGYRQADRLRSNREKLPERRQGLHPEAVVGGHKVYLRTGGICRWQAGRDLHRHAQGRRWLPRDDEQFRHRRVGRAAIRCAAGRVRRCLHLHPLLNRRAWCRAMNSIKNATSILDYIFRELAVSYLDRTDLAHVKPAGTAFDDLGAGENRRPAQCC